MRRSALAVLLAAGAMLSAGACDRPGEEPSGATPSFDELRPVPEPELSAAEPAVREQLEGKLEHLRQLRDEPGSSSEDIAQAFGDLGLNYIVYDFLTAAEACFDNARMLAPGDFRWAYLLGYLRQAQGRLAEAIPLLEASLELEPRYLPAVLRLGRARLELGELPEAKSWFERALELDPEIAAAHEGLGKVAAARGDDGAAAKHFERALALEPEASGIYYALGQVYRRLGDLEQARLALERSGDVPARIPDPLINPLASAAQSEQFYYMQAAEAMEDRDYEAAAGAFTGLLERNPTAFRGYRGLAQSLERIGDLAGAAAALERALEKATTGDAEEDRVQRADIHRLLAGVMVLRGLDREALEHFQGSLELVPAQPVVHLRFANALARSGRFEEALAQYDAFLDLEPQQAPVALEKRAAVLVNLGRTGEAVADYRRALEAAPKDPVLRLRFARVLEYLGDTAEAERQRRAAEGMAGEGMARARFLTESAHLRSSRGDYPGAVERYREALELMPGNLEARYGLAAVLGHQGRYPEAVEAFEQVLAAEPRHGAARRGQIAAFILSGRYGEARVRLQEALRLFPRDAALALLQVRLLSTVPDPRVRDGELALAIAERVVQEHQVPAARQALALALAEAGRFAEATELQRELASKATGPEELRLARDRLAAFEAGRPWTARSPEEILGGPAG